MRRLLLLVAVLPLVGCHEKPALSIPATRFVDKRGKAKEMTKLVNLGRPRILLVSIPKAEYRPVLQRPFEDAIAAARRNVSDLMAAELAETIRHQGYTAARGRIGDVMASAKQAIDRGDGPRANALHGEARSLLDRMNALAPRR